MTIGEVVGHVYTVASQWAYIRSVSIIDRTDYAIKMRLYVEAECFVQVYTNVLKDLVSYTLVLNRSRIFGRDCEGGLWHRHPRHAPDTHDASPQGTQQVSLSAFLAEAQQLLQDEGVL